MIVVISCTMAWRSHGAHSFLDLQPRSRISRAGFGGAACSRFFLSGAAFEGARPIDPNSTKQAPATINQCGIASLNLPSRVSFSLASLA
jgi:hypothetical protein